MLSSAVKKAFFDGKLDCSAGVNDLFYSNRRRTKVDFENQNWNYNAKDDTRRLVVSINYNFGKIKVTERKTTGNEEEKKRLNK
ncbi:MULTISPECIES: outer membrane beta-barrel protein [Flavobacterium]|uniref:Outer membrane protein beta-barrel domain-containing protein n=1 Tax=Flavobacterium columnare TaxID=996 RepID=A0A437UCF1_9FLAO|nr:MULTISPECIES: outer membrane beta-barrel protein [Flavobacterium]QYS89915.1 outer membrane beta-barrel protein [Flavobacterium davisii]RVU91208.1 hypothetical protein EH230_10010 [Flavobacterium columnare]